MMPNGILLAQDHFTGVSKMIACLSLQRISSALRKRVGESGIMFGAGKTRELLTDERAAMEAYKREFIEFMVQSDVLKFGDFTLKSGRKSPFFMNAGAYVTGEQLHRLGLYYAQAINDNFGLDFDVVFGPAYKGIPLAVVTAMALQELYGKEVKYCCNRKEVKDHGEGGVFVGYVPKAGEDVVIVEDVITAGTAIRESMAILRHLEGVKVAATFIMVDRKERGKGEKLAMEEVEEEFGFPVYSVVDVYDIIAYLEENPANDENVARIKNYLAVNGAKA